MFVNKFEVEALTVWAHLCDFKLIGEGGLYLMRLSFYLFSHYNLTILFLRID